MPDSNEELILQRYNFQQFIHSTFKTGGIFLINFSCILGIDFYRIFLQLY